MYTLIYDLTMFANKWDFELERMDFNSLVRSLFCCFIQNTLGVSCYLSLFALVSRVEADSCILDAIAWRRRHQHTCCDDGKGWREAKGLKSQGL